MRVLITGGRDFTDSECVNKTLDFMHGAYTITELIEGGAKGADYLARRWAVHNRISVVTYSAQWQVDGPRAGPIRNAAMLKGHPPDMCIAYPGGRGTADMVSRCERAGVEVWRVAVRERRAQGESCR